MINVYGLLIADYLPAADLFTMRLINKDFLEASHRLVKKRILSKRIITALKKRGYTDRFFELILKTKTIMSGSFLLGAINQEPWLPTADVDCFKKTDKYKELPSFGPLEDYFFTQLNNNVDQCAYENYFEEVSFLEHVRRYGITNETSSIDIPYAFKCDIIYVSLNFEGSCIDFIKSQFDFDFLKITFDGRDVTVWNTESVRTRTSRNYEVTRHIFQDYATGDFLYDEMNQVRENRVTKYINRGFFIQDTICGPYPYRIQ